MAQHPAYTMSALTAVGGIAGFLRARSVPSLVGGLLVSGLYATGGNLIAQNDDRGLATALGASVVLVGSSAKRALLRIPIPVALASLGLLNSAYYAQKMYRARVGY